MTFVGAVANHPNYIRNCIARAPSKVLKLASLSGYIHTPIEFTRNLKVEGLRRLPATGAVTAHQRTAIVVYSRCFRTFFRNKAKSHLLTPYRVAKACLSQTRIAFNPHKLIPSLRFLTATPK